MQDVADKIYKEYENNIENVISKDDFYKYFYNLLETGTTYCKFFNRKLIKEIDEEWVIQIEKALPHLQKVIDNPRTFIEESRQIVNIALAKKFTPESVKHLAQHSEMISKVHENGEVEPNRILNVYKEESENTYENRFIYTLLLELKIFVNKRTDVIFDNSKNEDGVKMEIDSVIDNYTETIQYKSTLRIQDRQTDLSNDSENINIFNRISKIHKMVNDLAVSGFCTEMKKYPLVKYPIVKTNAISKNQHYKACYDLWNFIRGYDHIGYKVEMMEQDPNISMSFEKDLYNMIIMNYAVVRNQMTIKDIMNIDHPLRERNIGVNMIKQFMREIVNEYGFTETEIKNLLLTELTKAEQEKEELRKKKEKIKQKEKNKNLDIQINEDNNWEDFTGVKKEEPSTNTNTAVTGRKMTKKQISKLKKKKKENERQIKLKQLEKEKEELTKIMKEEKQIEEIKTNIETEQKDENLSEINMTESIHEVQDNTETKIKRKKGFRLFKKWRKKD